VQSSLNDARDKAIKALQAEVAEKDERITKLEEAVAELGAFNHFFTLKKQMMKDVVGEQEGAVGPQ
jgi:t-SNARE complex subunit (syntaxin)